MRKLLTLAVLMATLIACDKENNGGGGTPSTYQPTTTGSTWTYRNDNQLTGISTLYTVTATSKDTTALGQIFRVFSNGSGSEYYRQSGTDYYQYGRLEGLGNPLEFPFLKSSAAVGANWNIPIPISVSGVNITVDAKFSITQKGITHTVNGKAYNNVIVVDVLLTPPPLVVITAQKIKYYYAEGVGRIQADVLVQAPIAGINVNNITTLQSYSIAP